MGILDPSPSDTDEQKKPRFRQDFMVLLIMVGGVLLFLLLDWLF